MPKATRQQTKEHNTRLVLKTIYNQDRISRADIARATRLTKTTVSSIVADLIHEGLVEETGLGTSDGGKPPILLSVVDGARHFIGLDHTQLDNTQGLASSNYALMYPIAYRTLASLHEDDTAAISASAAASGRLISSIVSACRSTRPTAKLPSNLSTPSSIIC